MVKNDTHTAVLGRPPFLPLLRLEGRPVLLELVLFRRTLPRELLRLMLVEDGVTGETVVTVGNRTLLDSTADAVAALARFSVASLIPYWIKPLPKAFWNQCL